MTIDFDGFLDTTDRAPGAFKSTSLFTLQLPTDDPSAFTVNNVPLSNLGVQVERLPNLQPQPIPLPPAFWPGLATLLTTAAAVSRRKLRNRADRLRLPTL
jgi:hypothetical protein